MFTNPRKAATVSILRDYSGKLEVLLMQRHLDDRFLPDYHVFPGGALDYQDYDFEFTADAGAHIHKDFDGTSKEYYGHLICGIRETFEESGILFAVDEKGDYPQINTGELINKYSLYRKQVFKKEISFREMLISENLIPAVDKFSYISRWITPVFLPIRYDARFFAAIVPENQEISHDGDELVSSRWMTAEEALQSFKNNKIKLVMPTIKTLKFLNKFSSTGDVIDYLKK